MSALVVRGPAVIEGDTTVPGDKSISHRAMMLAGVAVGLSNLTGLGPGEDLAATRRCLAAYGVRIEGDGPDLTVQSEGINAWAEPAETLDCANSGTTIRLLAGLAARCPFPSRLDGDESLRRRPMDRVVHPLRELGAHVDAVDERFPPLLIKGGALTGTDITIEAPSAQVKSCAIFAALGADGATQIRMPVRTRDHTELLLGALGAPVRSQEMGDGSVEISIEPSEPGPFDCEVPGDVSSASFLVAAAMMCGNVRVRDVGLNPTRTGFLDVCRRMGGAVEADVESTRLGEDVGTITAQRSDLHGLGIEGAVVPLMIDEVPLVAVLGTAATGSTLVSGAGELRIKESDRIATVCSELRAMGASIEEREDGFEVGGPTRLHGAVVDSHGDHRIAMALAIAALAADGETRIQGFEAAAVSWPGFERVLEALGAEVELQ